MTTRNPLILSNGLISEMTAGDAITASASIIISVLNQTGSTLTKGQAVYISGANGDNPTVTLASASAETTSSKTLGLVYADIANGNIGSVVTSGLFIGVDTSTATAGQSVWLSSTPGGLVFGAQPTQPLHGVFIGKVARVQQNNGSIFVTIQNGYEISELHDVLITSPANNNLLAYDSATSLWKNVSAINGVSVGSTTAAAGAFTTLSASSTVSGTGFSTYLASPPAIGSTTASTGAFTTLSASSTVTLSGGTANGVLYLNGSKAATSGSALTFDGTNLVTTGIASATQFQATSGSPGFSISNQATNSARAQFTNTGGTVYIGLDNSAGGLGGSYTMNYWYTGNYPHVWALNSTEQMRLTSTGLGIGTSSPAFKLDVAGNISLSNGSLQKLYWNNTGNYLNWIECGGTSGANWMRFATGNAEVMRLDSTGLGIGTSSPGTWSGAKLVLQTATSTASQFAIDNSSYAAGQTIGIDFTVAGGSKQAFVRGIVENGTTAATSLAFGTASGGNNVAERMRLDSSGNLGLGGITANASAILDAQSTTKGVRFPNMTTTQKNAIASPAAGLVVFDTTLSKLCLYTGAAWQTITSV